MSKNSDKNGNSDDTRCSFCGRTAEQVGQLITSPTEATICHNCVEICSGLYHDDTSADAANSNSIPKLEIQTPKKLHAQLNKYVVGQETAKRLSL